MNSQADAIHPADATISPPQPIWLVLLLVFVTFGVYLIVYFYQHGRDVKHLNHPHGKPWLWLWVPLLPLALPFAMHKLGKNYAQVARSLQVDFVNNACLVGIVILVLEIVGRVAARFFSHFESSIMLVAAALIAMSFSSFARQVNTLKRALPDRCFRSKPYRVRPASWIVLGVGSLVWIPLFVFGAYVEMRHSLLPILPEGERWISADKTYSLASDGQCSGAKLGTYSDGSAVSEFAASSAVSTIIFEKSVGVTINELSDQRREAFHREYDDAMCQELRGLTKHTLVRWVRLICEAKEPGFPREVALRVSTFIENGTTHFEVYGNAIVYRRERAVARKQLIKFADGFRIESTDDRGAK